MRKVFDFLQFILRNPFFLDVEILSSTKTKERLGCVTKTQWRFVIKLISIPYLCIFFLASKNFWGTIFNLFTLIFKMGVLVFSTAASHCHGGQVCLNDKQVFCAPHTPGDCDWLVSCSVQWALTAFPTAFPFHSPCIVGRWELVMCWHCLLFS